MVIDWDNTGPDVEGENANSWNGTRELNRHERKIYMGEYKQRETL